jgi:Xaa-Pro aminopeptidase
MFSFRTEGIMNRFRATAVPFLFVVCSAWATGWVRESEFLARRDAVAARLDSVSVAIFHTADGKQRSADVDYRFRQESNLLYLTGLNEPGVTLIVAGRPVTLDGAQVTRILLVRPEFQKTMAGRATFKDMLLLDVARLRDVLSIVLGDAKTLYLSAPDLRFTNDWLNDKPVFIDRDSRKEVEHRFPGLKVKSAAPLVSRLREIKSQAELELIRKSIKATGDGILRAMRVSRPGGYEYELQAAVEYEMTNQGAEYEGFPSIIGSGPNSLILHYDKNRRQMQKGDLVVMDVGAEMEGYSADVTRTFPVDGEFTPAQREVYAAVLGAQKAVINIIKPGLPFADLDRTARASLERSGFGKYMPHGVSHHLGLDTHDAGGYDTLRAGMVITVEPGIYIPAEDTIKAPEYRGWGVRIEDDVLVIGSGAQVLSSSIPKEVEEIERLMQR